MIPVQDLFNRIIWDKDFGRGSFEIGYYDRIAGKIIRVPFSMIELIPGDHFSFYLYDPDGETCSIPFHRVRQVFKDGQLIWHRGD